MKSPTQPFLVGALFFSFNSLSKLSEPLTKHCQLSGVTRSEQNNWHHGSWRLVTSVEHLNSGHSSVVHLRSEHLLSSLTATLAFHKPRPVRGLEDDHLVQTPHQKRQPLTQRWWQLETVGECFICFIRDCDP